MPDASCDDEYGEDCLLIRLGNMEVFGYFSRLVLVELWAGTDWNGQVSEWEFVRKGDNECRLLRTPVCP